MSAWRSAARQLLGHALPIFVAQLASIGMMVVDTVVLGHIGARDLAAIAIGGGLHISVVFALVGILQALGPMVARAHGAGKASEAASLLWQGLWLALALSLPGAGILLHPGPLLGLVEVDPVVEQAVRQYLALLAWGLPAALTYRTLYIFCNALGRPRVLMAIGLAALALHAFLAWGFATHGWLGIPRGVLGCAWSNLLIGILATLVLLLYLRRSGAPAATAFFAACDRPRWQVWRGLLRLGLPMGVSNFVEITSFTLISLFIASLGPVVVAGHRIAANFSALTYMLPLSLGIATMVAVGHALGARDFRLARIGVQAGLGLAALFSLISGGVLWAATAPLVALYTDDPAVRGVAGTLVIYIAIYQFFDALQTIASHALRAYHVTFVPMLIQTSCFWGVGLLGGAWLCFRHDPPYGVAGFWLAASLSLIAAAALLLPMLSRVIRETSGSP